MWERQQAPGKQGNCSAHPQIGCPGYPSALSPIIIVNIWLELIPQQAPSRPHPIGCIQSFSDNLNAVFIRSWAQRNSANNNQRPDEYSRYMYSFHLADEIRVVISTGFLLTDGKHWGTLELKTYPKSLSKKQGVKVKSRPWDLRGDHRAPNMTATQTLENQNLKLELLKGSYNQWRMRKLCSS